MLITNVVNFRLYNYIQPASNLNQGCDYSLFKVSELCKRYETLVHCFKVVYAAFYAD